MISFKKINRRKFLTKTLYAILSLQVVYLFVKLLDPKKFQPQSNNFYEAGDVSLFEKGHIYSFGTEGFFLHRLSDGGFLAVSSKCTHLGCAVQVNSQNHRYECPCHGSAFSVKGEVLSAPATRPLDYFNIKIEDHKVLVDVNNPIRRDQFLKSQVKYI